MNMIIPPYIKKGDKVGIVSPAGRVSKDNIEKAKIILESWGLEVIFGENIFSQHFQFGGSDEERFLDFQLMMDDPEIKTIFCSRGGYGTIRIIDRLDFSKFQKNPKWIVGFSDITVLHSHLNNKLKIASIHGPMPNSYFKYDKDKTLDYLKKTLFGIDIQYNIEPHALNRNGVIKSDVWGGNLNVLHNLMGSDSDFHPEGKILFIEDIGEYLYNIDRMMWGLKRAGKLKNLAGLIVGQFTDSKDNKNPFGKTEYEIIREHIEEYDYPVCFGFPAGHGEMNYSLNFGIKYNLEIINEHVILINS